MPHFFIPPENIQGAQFVLSGPEVHHLVGVRRVRQGDLLHLFDGTGKTYVGRIEHADREEIRGLILEQGDAPSAAVRVCLYQAVPKGDRFDWLVEKAAELGVAAVIPLITGRSVMRDIPTVKVERWKRLGLGACQQCGRADMLRIENPAAFSAAVDAAAGQGMNLLPWEGEETKTLESSFDGKIIENVSIFIGPEGGFTLDEVAYARQHGFVVVTLGQRILRAETAGLLASILALRHFGEFTHFSPSR